MTDLLLKVNVHKFAKKHSFWGYIFLVIVAICAFFVSLWVLQTACKVIGQNYITDIIRATINPFVGLFIGLLATALIQSSSTTVSITLIFLSSGLLKLDHAVPIVMGANIGTTLTSTFFAIGYLGNKKQFRKAISAATLHDFFNLFTTLVLFPLEYYFNILSVSAEYLSKYIFAFTQTQQGLFQFEISTGNVIFRWLGDWFNEYTYIPAIIAFITLLISFKTFSLTIRNMVVRDKTLPTDNFILNSNLTAVLSGTLITGIVQSSSAIASIMIPWVVEKRISLKKLFPFLMGVNLGTTLTAFIVALGQNEVAVSLALVHVFFNLIGILLLLPIKPLRYIPLWCAKKLGRLVWKNQLIGLAYVLLIFFLIPYLLISLS